MYSLGLAFWELFGTNSQNKVPFKEFKAAATLVNHLKKDPNGVAPLDWSVDMPDMMRQLIRDMCVNNYLKRPSAAEVKQRLQAVLPNVDVARHQISDAGAHVPC